MGNVTVDISNRIVAYFDGACGPVNPGGHIGYGCIVIDNGLKVYEYGGYSAPKPHYTSNMAEYIALENVLDYLTANGYHSDRVIVYGDSKLVVNQMKGRWGIGKHPYAEYAKRCMYKILGLNITMAWIPREHNTEADKLSKEQFIRRGIIKAPTNILLRQDH